MMKRSGNKAKYSPMEKAKVYQVQFTTIPENLLVCFIIISEQMVSGGN
jgi:hypothetical protein